MNLGIYALGGGIGHMQRSAGLARLAVQQGFSVSVLVNSPFANQFIRFLESSPLFGSYLANESLQFTVFDSKTPIQAAREFALNWCQRNPWDAFVVDTFPRGLGGELAGWLPETSFPCYLIGRGISSSYVQTIDLQSIAVWFEKIFLPGEGNSFSVFSQSIPTDRWIICDSKECFSASEARQQLLGSDDRRPVVAVIGSGKDSEVAEMQELACRISDRISKDVGVCFFDPLSQDKKFPQSDSNLNTVCHWPMLQLIQGIDLVIGSGGYNTVAECEVSGTPLWAIPRQRLYDRQDVRLKNHSIFDSPKDLIDRFGRFVKENQILNKCAEPSFPSFRSGAHMAVSEILKLAS